MSAFVQYVASKVPTALALGRIHLTGKFLLASCKFPDGVREYFLFDHRIQRERRMDHWSENGCTAPECHRNHPTDNLADHRAFVPAPVAPSHPTHVME